MSNTWIDHIKSYAQQHGLSYGCALSDPNCSKSYKEKQNPTTQTKPNAAAKARAIAAVKTLTSAPKTLATPAPAKAPPPPPKPNSGYLSTNRSNKHLLRKLPKEWKEYFNKGDYDYTRSQKIELLKDGVKFDKNINHRELDELYQNKYWRSKVP